MSDKRKEAVKNEEPAALVSATEFASLGGIARSRQAGFYHTVRAMNGGREPGSVRKTAAEWADIFQRIDRGELP